MVYKVDRLSRSLLDFARLIAVFERHRVSFVSVTQDFSTTSSLGRLTLNILLSFAQFEREMIGERTRDKVSAARRKGKWTGGIPVLGYDVDPRGGRLVVNEEEAARVREIFAICAACDTLTCGAGAGAGARFQDQRLDQRERQTPCRSTVRQRQSEGAAGKYRLHRMDPVTRARHTRANSRPLSSGN